MERLNQLIKKQYAKVPKECKIAVVSVIVFGLLAHNYMFTNKLPNYDDMGITGFGATFRLGRWFLWVLGAAVYHLDFSYSLPWINGIVSLVFIAVSAALLVYIFNLKNKLSIILISGMLVVFPSWTATFFFMFTALYYSLAVFLGVLGVFFTVTYRKGYILAVLCTVLSLGIYQAYFPFIASLYVMVLIQNLVQNETIRVREKIKNSFKYLFLLVGSIILYGIITELTLLITGQQLASYRGLDNVGTISIEKIGLIIKEIFTCFASLCLGNDYELSCNVLLKAGYTIAFLFWLIESIICVCILLNQKRKIESIWFVILSLALFISINGICIMCPEPDAVYSLMRYAYVLIPVYPLILADICIENFSGKMNVILCENILTCVIFIMSLTYCHFANAQYLSMDLGLKQTIGFYTPIITQIKSLDGYTDETEVIFIGVNETEIDDKTMYHNDVMRKFDISGRDSILSQTGSLNYLLSIYCGFNPSKLEYYMGEGTRGIDEIEDMPVYPENGSIQMINGKAIVKLAE